MPINDEQREARRLKLGSSDSPAVVGVDPWKSAYDVYLEKTAAMAEVDQTEAIELGNAFELPLLSWAASQLGMEIDINVPVVNPGKSLFAANLDARAADDGVRVAFEAKVTSIPDEYGEEGTDNVPDRVMVQCQHQLFAGELDVVYVPVLLARYDRLQRRLYRVARHERLIDAVVQRGLSFWSNHVLPRVPPDGMVPSLDGLKRISRVAGAVAPISPELVERFEVAKEAKKSAEAEEEEAKAALLAALGEAEVADYGDAEHVYAYRQQARAGIQAKRLRAAHPDIYKEFLKISTFRVLRRIKRHGKVG